MNCYTFRLHLPTGDIDKEIVTTSLHEAWQLVVMPEARFMKDCLGIYLKDEYEIVFKEEIREYYEGGRGMGTL